MLVFVVALVRWVPSWLVLLPITFLLLLVQGLWVGMWHGAPTQGRRWVFPLNSGVVNGKWVGCTPESAVCELPVSGFDTTTPWWHAIPPGAVPAVRLDRRAPTPARPRHVDLVRGCGSPGCRAGHHPDRRRRDVHRRPIEVSDTYDLDRSPVRIVDGGASGYSIRRLGLPAVAAGARCAGFLRSEPPSPGIPATSCMCCVWTLCCSLRLPSRSTIRRHRSRGRRRSPPATAPVGDRDHRNGDAGCVRHRGRRRRRHRNARSPTAGVAGDATPGTDGDRLADRGGARGRHRQGCTWSPRGSAARLGIDRECHRRGSPGGCGPMQVTAGTRPASSGA